MVVFIYFNLYKFESMPTSLFLIIIVSIIEEEELVKEEALEAESVNLSLNSIIYKNMNPKTTMMR